MSAMSSSSSGSIRLDNPQHGTGGSSCAIGPLAATNSIQLDLSNVPLFEREADVAALEAAYKSCAASSLVAMVQGPAGSGKTCLVLGNG
jgi:hypothetical protein